MKRILLTAGLICFSTSAMARRADSILESDPNGIYVTIISVGTVLVALIVLFLLISLFAKIMMRSARKKAAQSSKAKAVNGEKSASVECESDVNGEIIAAIALAVKMNQAEMHDQESDVITINKVARVYSPWSSKIHGLTQMPERIRK